MRTFILSSFTSLAIALSTLTAATGTYAQAAPLASPSAPAASAKTQPCPAVLQHSADRLQDEKPQSLCQYSGKVVVVVNTASFCGFTSQYKGLESLHDKYQGRGLVVLGFPSNDFSQESSSNKQIADFCESTFGVKFPMFTKTSVSGKDASPLFKQLASTTSTPPRWNFYKYLISRDGSTVTAFNSMTEPGSSKFIAEVEKQLARP